MFTGFTYLLTAEYRKIPSISGLIVDYLTCCSYALMVCQLSDSQEVEPFHRISFRNIGEITNIVSPS
ncbi:hypothetical protein I7I48_01277 [Histoplasma ohiense]|nr:hypothetical protein I7I48_01277 [Histoplasma ohiense (nom. inval.)]